MWDLVEKDTYQKLDNICLRISVLSSILRNMQCFVFQYARIIQKLGFDAKFKVYISQYIAVFAFFCLCARAI